VNDEPGHRREAPNASTKATRPARFTDLLFQTATASRCSTRMASLLRRVAPQNGHNCAPDGTLSSNFTESTPSPSTRRGGRHRPDGARHPRRHPPPSSASVMRMTAIQAPTERKRQDGSARCAEKHRRRDTTRRLRGPICPAPQACAFADTSRGEIRLSSCRIQAIFTSDAMALEDCRLDSKIKR
jgi:hypothetical protein